MVSVRKELEIAVHVVRDPKALEKLLALVSAWGMRVDAYCCYFTGTQSIALLVTDNGDQTYCRLERAGYECEIGSVVLVATPRQIAASAQLGLELTAARIGILSSYVSWLGTDRIYTVFKTTDDERAFRILSAHPLTQGISEEAARPRSLRMGTAGMETWNDLMNQIANATAFAP